MIVLTTGVSSDPGPGRVLASVVVVIKNNYGAAGFEVSELRFLPLLRLTVNVPHVAAIPQPQPAVEHISMRRWLEARHPTCNEAEAHRLGFDAGGGDFDHSDEGAVV